jgi:uncharacterized damage-inducible protein DinB
MKRAATDAIIDSLERAPAIVVPLARQAPAETRKRRPPSGKWSIHEHVVHLADVDALMSRRLELMLSDADPVIYSYDPGRDEPDGRLLQLDFDEAVERYARNRIGVVERLRALNLSDWRKTAHHEEYNSYSVFTMFRHLALHDFQHAYRIEELILRQDWPAPFEPELE